MMNTPFLTACNYASDEVEGDPTLSWGIWMENGDASDWIFDSDDLTEEQAEDVAAMFNRHWPDAAALEADEAWPLTVDAVVAAVKAGRIVNRTTVHDGTAWAIFHATVEDVLAEFAMTLEDAKEMGPALDFSDTYEADAVQDDGEEA